MKVKILWIRWIRLKASILAVRPLHNNMSNMIDLTGGHLHSPVILALAKVLTGWEDVGAKEGPTCRFTLHSRTIQRLCLAWEAINLNIRMRIILILWQFIALPTLIEALRFSLLWKNYPYDRQEDGILTGILLKVCDNSNIVSIRNDIMRTIVQHATNTRKNLKTIQQEVYRKFSPPCNGIPITYPHKVRVCIPSGSSRGIAITLPPSAEWGVCRLSSTRCACTPTLRHSNRMASQRYKTSLWTGTIGVL
mmetsp:Transcript_33218/g.69873  ORF Transcript_33218/g.69873 Transcript_33218/m.69873 type:complete len:250 (-) Transcript_33218:370-1119(-)